MKAIKPATLGTLEFDAIIDRKSTYEATVPEHATEEGYSVSDHICRKAVTLDVTAVFTNTPVTWADRHAPSLSRVETMCSELEKLWEKGELLTFSAAGDTYENMCIESIEEPREAAYGSTVRVRLRLKQITVTKTDTATISLSYARGGASGQNTGAGQTSSASADGEADSSGSSSRSSLLCSAAKAAGLFK